MDLGKLKSNMYTFTDGDDIIYCNTLTQGVLLEVSSKETTEEEKVEIVFKSMLSPSIYEKYKEEPYQVKAALATDYLNWHMQRLEEKFPSSVDTK